MLGVGTTYRGVHGIPTHNLSGGLKVATTNVQAGGSQPDLLKLYRGDIMIVNIDDINNPTWMNKSVCKEYPPDWFIVDKSNNHDAKKAKAVCDICPVKQECLDWAVSIEAKTASMPGIYGGKTQQERRDFRVCKYAPCTNSITIVNKTPRAQNNFCSEEHQKAQRLLAKKAKKEEPSNRHEYYMKGILHHG